MASAGPPLRSNLGEMGRARIDQITGGIYRISIFSPQAGITFNQFLIEDEAPTLVHTGLHADYEDIAAAVAEVIDPALLANIILLHWEGDENGAWIDSCREREGRPSSARPCRSP